MATGTEPQQNSGGVRAGTRAAIDAPHLRTDRWWLAPAATAAGLLAFVVYSTWRAFADTDYYAAPYVSPFYSPCLAERCAPMRHGPNWELFGSWWAISPAIIILIFPLGFRLTCYYYRKAYYRSFWRAPAACAVAEPHAKYTGESRFPLIVQNSHRYFFYLGLILNVILSYDAVISFRDHNGNWGHMGLGSLVLLVNAALLWFYSLTCHSCRHAIGGRLTHFSRHPVRYWMWSKVSKWNHYHMQFAWMSLIFVALTDLYVRLVASGTITDLRFF